MLQPQAPELEETILGACLIEKEGMALVDELLKPEMFYVTRHQLIYAALQAMFHAGTNIDILTATEELRKRGGDRGEYGATTGRPRRVGWFDCVATRYGCEMQGATEVAMTNLDVLGYLDEIPVCVAYELNGERVDHFPVTPKLEQCKPIYVKLPGWKCDTRGIKNFDELPENARHYIEFLEKEVGCPFKLISNGPRRDEIIYR